MFTAFNAVFTVYGVKLLFIYINIIVKCGRIVCWCDYCCLNYLNLAAHSNCCISSAHLQFKVHRFDLTERLVTIVKQTTCCRLKPQTTRMRWRWEGGRLRDGQAERLSDRSAMDLKNSDFGIDWS